MTRFFFTFSITLFALTSFLIKAPDSQAQEVLLELPGSSARTSPTEALEILSPNEISDLYKDNSLVEPPPPALEPVPEQKVKPVIKEPAKQDSFSKLLQDLESDTADQSPDSFDINNLWSRQSVMLLPAEVKTFNAAIRRYLKLKEQPVVIVEETEPEEEVVEDKTPPVGKYPFIALSSIMYVSPNNWAVWINGKRYTPMKTEPLAGITIESLTKNNVRLRWKRAIPSPQTSRNRNTPEEVITEDFSKADSASGKIERIDGRTYIITLSPNQAFITQDFEIHEGRVANQRISEIYQEQIAIKHAELNDLNNPSKVEETRLDPIAIQEQKDKEDIAKLLELYRISESQNQ